MRVEARVLQAALKSYDFWGDNGPLVLDGVIGDETHVALYTFDDWVSRDETGTWGDYSIIPAADNRSVEISPDSVARRLSSRGTAYLAEHPEEVVFPRERSAPAPATHDSAAPLAPVALPFWRSSNPWAWLLSAFGFFGLSGVAFWVGKRMRRA